jgi:hypothetical protein
MANNTLRRITTNQIFENVYCNSDSYNDIYDINLILHRINPILSAIERQYIAPNMNFFSNMLNININFTNDIHHQYNLYGEIDRRGLSIAIDVYHVPLGDYIFFGIRYKYVFDCHPNGRTFTIGNDEKINGKDCECLYISPTNNNYYTFQTKLMNLFHFTFHTPNNDEPQNKAKGSFHLKIDSMKIKPSKKYIVPYRPFIIDPRSTTSPKQFIKWDLFDSSMNNFFTTTNTMSGVNDIKTFLTKFPVRLSYPNTSTQNVHYINSIIKQIYNKIVTDVLNPIPTIHTTITSIPAAVEYRRNGPIIDCSGLLKIGLDHNNWITHHDHNPSRKVIYGGKRRRKTLRKPRFP